MAFALPSPALRWRVRSRERAVSSCASRSTLDAVAAHRRPVWTKQHLGFGQPTRVRAAALGAAHDLRSRLANPRLMPQHLRTRNTRALVINPGDEGTPWVDPSSDLMLSDITEEVLTADVASMLGVTHLMAVSADDVVWPVRALLYGVFSRVMVSLVVSAPRASGQAARSLNVIFLVDTGSPYTFISQSTYEALGYSDSLPKAAQLRVHGANITVQPSHSHFKDVNVLGTDFLVRARCSLMLDFANAVGTLDKSGEAM